MITEFKDVFSPLINKVADDANCLIIRIINNALLNKNGTNDESFRSYRYFPLLGRK